MGDCKVNLVRCGDPKCGKFYHFNCAQALSLCRIEKELLICPVSLSCLVSSFFFYYFLQPPRTFIFISLGGSFTRATCATNQGNNSFVVSFVFQHTTTNVYQGRLCCRVDFMEFVVLMRKAKFTMKW